MTDDKIIEQFLYWAKKFKIKKLYISKDDDTIYAAYVTETFTRVPVIFYNKEHINDYANDRLFTSVAFHELGHVKYKTSRYRSNSSIKHKIKSEYLAEKYSLMMHKKYCKKNVNHLIKYSRAMIDDTEWAKLWPIHAKAFRKVYGELK